MIFGGGIPVWYGDHIVGAVGASAGTVEQDIIVAEAAIAALGWSSKSLAPDQAGADPIAI